MLATHSASLGTAQAHQFVASLAALTAASADRPFAVAAHRSAVAAQLLFAAPARTRVFSVHQSATVMAGHSIPLVKLDKRPTLGIGLQRPVDDCEEIKDSATFAGQFRHPLTISLTEHFGADVGMGNILAGCRWMRLKRHHVVRLGLGQTCEIESDLKRPQVNIIQRDRLRCDREHLVNQIAFHLRKLVLQGR